MAKTYNNVSMKGRLYAYNLEADTNDKGEPIIKGDIRVEVDTDGTIGIINFYASPIYSTGKKNSTYEVLDEILAGNYKTVTDNGDDADWLAVTGSIDVNYFVSSRSKDGELARSQRIRGAFINPNTEKKYDNKWKLDLLMTKIQEIDEDPEKQLPRYAKVFGYLIDAYRERMMEVMFQARKDAAINYLIGIDCSAKAPYFASTWGRLSKTTRTVVRQNAFGEDEIDEYDSTAWTIEGQAPTPYDFDDESTITATTYTAYVEAMEKLKEEAENKSNESGGKKKPELAF